MASCSLQRLMGRSVRRLSLAGLIGATAFGLGLQQNSAQAQTTYTWTNTAGGSWGTAANWSGSILPTFAASNILDFSTLNIAAAASVTLDANRTIGTVKFGDTNSTHDWSINAGTPTTSILTLSGTPTIQVNNRTATFNVPITLADGTLSKTGNGTAVLNGLLTGWVPALVDTVTAGNLTLGLGTGVNFDFSSTIKTAGAGTVQYNGVTTLTLPSTYSVGAGGITLNPASGTFVGASGFTKTGAGTLTLATAGTATTSVGGTYDITGTLAINTVASGSAGLTKTGTGTLILNSAANTFSGVTTINGGVLQIRDGSTNSPTYLTTGALAASSIVVGNTATLDLPRLHATTTQTVNWTLPAVTLQDGSTLRFRASTGTNAHVLPAAISASGTVTINNNGGAFGQDITYSGALSGSGTLNYFVTTNQGSSTGRAQAFNVTSANNAYTGNWFVDYTVASADDFATLQSSAVGSLGTGGVTLDDRARLLTSIANGLDSVSAVTLAKSTSSLLANTGWSNPAGVLTVTDGTVTIGTAVVTPAAYTYGTINIASASQAGGSIAIDAGTAGNDTITLSGDFTATGGALNVTFNSAPLATHTLVTAGSITGTPTVNIAGLTGSRFTPTVNQTATTLTITTTGAAASLIWTGTNSSEWDLLTQNFTNAGNPDTYFVYDNVTFDDTATNFTVNTGTNVTPNSVTFNNTTPNDYTLTGTAGITGLTGLVKSGTGVLNIQNVNNYVGATAINAGTVNLTGTLANTPITVSGSAVLSQGSTGTISGTSSLTHNSSATSVLAGIKTYTGATTITAGTLEIDTDGGELTASSGVAISPGATLLVTKDDSSFTFSRNLSGAGTVVLNPVTSSSSSGSKDVTLSGTNTSFTGNLLLTTGAGTGSFRVILPNVPANLGGAAIEIDDRAQLWTAGNVTNNIKLSGMGYEEVAGGFPAANLTALAPNLSYGGIGAIRLNSSGIFSGTITLDGPAKIGAYGVTGTFSNNITNTNSTDILVVGGGGLGSTVILTGDNSGLEQIWVNSGSGSSSGTDNLQIGNNGTTGTLGSGDVILHADSAKTAVLRFSRSDGYTLAPGQDILADVAASADYARTTLDVRTTGTGLNLGGSTVDLSDGTTGGLLAIGNITGTPSVTMGPGSLVDLGNLQIGEGSGNSANMTQNGGTLNVINQVRVGHWGNETSNYNLTAGNFNVTGASPGTSPSGGGEQNGGIYVGIDGRGIFNQSGGVVSTNFVVLDNRGNTGAGTNMTSDLDQYNLSGGTLTLKSTWGVIQRNTGEFNFSGGTINIDNTTAGTDITVPLDTTINTSGTGGTLDTVTAGNAFTLTRNVTGTAPITTAGGGVINLSTTGTQSIAAVIAGVNPVKKIGTGTSTLAAANTYNGPTTVEVGTLNLTGSLANSDVTVNDGAAISGEGSAKTLTLGNFSSATVLINGQTAGALTSTGTLTVNGTATVDFSPYPLVNTAVSVLNHGGTTALDTNFALNNVGNYRQAVFVVNPTNVTLDIGRKDLVWAGTSANWELQGGDLDWNAGADNFYYGDGVTFDDTAAANTAVTLVGALQPSIVTVNSNTNNYTLTSSASNIITGPGSLVKQGTSTLTMAGVANTYNGGTTISNGAINVRIAGALGSGTVTLTDASTGSNNTALYLDSARVNFGTPIVVANNGTGTVTLGSRSTVTGTGDNNQFTNITLARDVIFDSNATDRTDYENISGTGNIRVTGTGRSIFITNNTYVGNLTIATTGAGSVQLSTASAAFDAIPNTSNVTIESGAVLNLSFSSGSETIAGLFGAGTLGNNSGTSNLLIVGNGDTGGNFTGNINGNVQLTKTGTGTQVINSVNSATTGNVIVNGGTLQIDGRMSGSGTYTVNNGGTLTVLGTGVLFNTGSFFGATNTTYLTVNTGGLAVLDRFGYDGTFADPTPSTNTSLSKLRNNYYSININGGTLQLTGTNSTNRAFTIGANGATIDVPTGSTYTKVAGTVGSQNIIYNNGSGSLTLTGGGTGTIQDILGTQSGYGTWGAAAGVIKSGTGTWTLAGNNTYTGVTTLSAGKLLINGNSSAATGAVNVSALATIGGSGTIGGLTTIASTGIVAPGNSTGNLTFANGVDLSAGGVYSWELGALSTSNPGTDFDTITVSGGNLALAGTSALTLDFALVGVNGPNSANAFWTTPQTWKIIDVTGGTNTGDTNLSTITNASYSSGSFTTTVGTGGDAGDVFLVFTPSVVGASTWIGASGDNWTAGTSWTGTVPNSASAEAQFTTTGGAIANLDVDQTVNKLTFDATTSNDYTISGPGELTLAGTTPSISLAATNTGDHTIAANVELGAGTTITVSGGSLSLNVPTTNATLGAGVTATVASGATLNLGGAGNALSNGTTHANVANSGTLTATTAGKRVGEISGTGTTTVTAAGATLTANHIRQSTLNIGAGNTVTVAANGGNSGTSVVTNLNINATGKLDLNDNDLVVDNGNLATLTAQLATGLDINGSYGNGPGITSTAFANNVDFNTVLGIAANVELGYTSFSGQTVDANDILIKYTYYGDADLSGSVDTSTDFDLYITGLTSGGSLGGWLFGDFDYSGTVDSSTDFDLYITGLTSQGAPLLTAGGGGNLVQAVPEPSTFVLGGLALLGFAGVGLRRRRMAQQQA